MFEKSIIRCFLLTLLHVSSYKYIQYTPLQTKLLIYVRMIQHRILAIKQYIFELRQTHRSENIIAPKQNRIKTHKMWPNEGLILTAFPIYLLIYCCTLYYSVERNEAKQTRNAGIE